MEISCKSSNILIKVNGENKSVPQNITILKLLDLFNLKKDRVVIELNKEIIQQDNFTKKLQSNDKLEIVTFVGGG